MSLRELRSQGAKWTQGAMGLGGPWGLMGLRDQGVSGDFAGSPPVILFSSSPLCQANG